MKVSIGDGSCGFCGAKAFFIKGLVFVDGKEDNFSMCQTCCDEMHEKLLKARAKSSHNKPHAGSLGRRK